MKNIEKKFQDNDVRLCSESMQNVMELIEMVRHNYRDEAVISELMDGGYIKFTLNLRHYVKVLAFSYMYGMGKFKQILTKEALNFANQILSPLAPFLVQPRLHQPLNVLLWTLLGRTLLSFLLEETRTNTESA